VQRVHKATKALKVRPAQLGLRAIKARLEIKALMEPPARQAPKELTVRLGLPGLRVTRGPLAQPEPKAQMERRGQLARLVLRVIRDPLVRPVRLELPVPKVRPAPRALMGRQAGRGPRVSRVLKARLEPQVSKGRLEPQVLKVIRVRLALLALRAARAQLVPPGRLAPPGLRAIRESKARLVQPGRKVTKDQPVPAEPMGLLARLGPRETKVRPEPLVQPAHRVRPEPKELTGRPEPPGLRVIQGRLVQREPRGPMARLGQLGLRAIRDPLVRLVPKATLAPKEPMA
jgi:hypothetical protein